MPTESNWAILNVLQTSIQSLRRVLSEMVYSSQLNTSPPRSSDSLFSYMDTIKIEQCQL